MGVQPFGLPDWLYAFHCFVENRQEILVRRQSVVCGYLRQHPKYYRKSIFYIKTTYFKKALEEKIPQAQIAKRKLQNLPLSIA